MKKGFLSVDYFMNNPGYKLISYYHEIPVFKMILKNPPEPGTTNRFWFGSTIENEKIIVLGPGFTRKDFYYAVCYMLKFSLKDHFIICFDDLAAVSMDIQYITVIDHVITYITPDNPE